MTTFSFSVVTGVWAQEKLGATKATATVSQARRLIVFLPNLGGDMGYGTWHAHPLLELRRN
jgi:hypothetical protein